MRYLFPRFFKDSVKDTKTIIDILSIYKNIYLDNGKKIELDDLLSKKRLKKPQNDVQNAEKSPTPRKHLKEYQFLKNISMHIFLELPKEKPRDYEKDLKY